MAGNGLLDLPFPNPAETGPTDSKLTDVISRLVPKGKAHRQSSRHNQQEKKMAFPKKDRSFHIGKPK